MAHTVVVERFSDILKNVDTVNNDALSSLKEELFRVEESLSHSLDLFIVMMVNFTAVVKHVTKVGDRKTHLVDGFCDLLV